MKKLIVLLIVFFRLISLQAQEAPAAEFYRLSLKFYPTFLVDFTGPSLEGGLEYRINEKWAVQQDFGYISTWDTRYFLSVDDMVGFRFRTSIRKYFGSDGGYQALAFGYKHVTRDRSDTFCREDCAYFEDIDYQLRGNDFSLHYLIGQKDEFWKIGLVDLNVGAGLRLFKRVRTPELPEDAFFSGINDDFTFRVRTNKWLLIPSAIISISVGIGK
ncbi:MAG: hypothetical protein KDC34_02095 [Saprospiraceae bacterium]|nr:hypothetical protein [Saprospiraceae bacterium]